MKRFFHSYHYILILLSFPFWVDAQNVWVGGASGSWSTASNWSYATTPSAIDTVQFTTDVVVDLDVDVTIKAMEIQGLSGTDVVINSSGGTMLTIDGSDVNNAGLRLDEGNFELGTGITLTIRNNVNSGIILDNMDTLVNKGTIYIEDFEATLGENDDGILINNSSLFINMGTLTIDDVAVEGGNNSYVFLIANESTFINAAGAEYRAVTAAMSNNVFNRDAILVTSNSVVVNDGTFILGNGDFTRIERFGIYNSTSSFTNNGSITINGTSNFAISNDNAGGIFTNNGTIDIDHADDGILNNLDADHFINNNQITIGDGDDTHIDDTGIRNYGIFDNYAQITINGTDDQGLYSAGTNAHFTNHSTGVITIDNVSSDQLRNGNSTDGSIFINEGRIDINQNSTITGGNAALYNDDFANFINRNGGIVNIDFVLNEGMRSDALGTNALVNQGTGSVINIGLMGVGSIGDGGNFDDAIYANGNIINEDGAAIYVNDASGRGLYITSTGNFTNDNGMVHIDNCLEHAVSIAAENGNKLLNTGPTAVFNIGQNGSVGSGQTDDNAVRCDGTFENSNGATLNIDNILGGYAFDLGGDVSADSDTLINDGGIINISQNNSFIDRPYNIRVRDACVIHNLNGGTINMSNVRDYGIHFSPQASLVNSGTIDISDYESEFGVDNAIYLKDCTWSNDGIVRINDPNTSGAFFAHALYVENTAVTMGPNSNIIVADASMTTGYIGGTAVYFKDCTIHNEGAFTIGNGDPMRIQANGIQLINTIYTSTATSNFTIDGLPVNTNGILVTSGSFAHAGTMLINHVHRGLYCASASDFFDNTGSIEIGNGIATDMGSFGIFNQTAFTNTGTIVINGTTADGIRSAHPNASFNNTGNIQIDNTLANGFTNGLGSNNPSPLTNDGGIIEIGLMNPNSIANIGLYIDDAGSLTNTNSGMITLGNANQVLQNEAMNGTELLNENCSIIHIQGDFTNQGVFQNNAILTIENGAYAFSNSIQNNGYIQDLADALNVTDRVVGMIDGIDNMGTVMTPLTSPCANESLQNVLVSETSDKSSLGFPTSATWYFDSDLTTIAGTFDSASNSFTFANPPSPNTTQTLYFDVDGTNACTYVGRIEIAIQDNPSCSSCPTNTIVSSNPADGDVISAANTVTTQGQVIVLSPNVVLFKAGTQIDLEAEFEVQLGASFEAKIEACSTYQQIPSNQ